MTRPTPRVVMFLYRPFDVDSRVEREARSLIAHGYEVEVIAVLAEDFAETESRDGYSIRRVSAISGGVRLAQRVVESRLPGVIRRLAFRTYALLIWRAWTRRASDLAGERPADLYIGHDLDGLRPAVRAKRRFGGPLIYDAHELYPDMATKTRPHYELRAWMLYESRLIRHADLVFAVTASRAEEMQRRFGGRIPAVLRNVPELSTPEGASSGVDLRAEAGISDDERMLLYLGALHPTRGLEEAIRALAQLPGCALVMMGFGDNGYIESLRRLAEQQGVSERIFIRPPVRPHQVVEVSAKADVGLVLNRKVGLNNYLSLPNKIFESVGAGLPVVVSDFPDMADLVHTYDVGETCDPEDPADIARAVRAVVEDSTRHAALRENALKAAPELSWEAESEVFLSQVRRLVSP